MELKYLNIYVKYGKCMLSQIIIIYVLPFSYFYYNIVHMTKI